MCCVFKFFKFLQRASWPSCAGREGGTSFFVLIFVNSRFFFASSSSGIYTRNGSASVQTRQHGLTPARSNHDPYPFSANGRSDIRAVKRHHCFRPPFPYTSYVRCFFFYLATVLKLVEVRERWRVSDIPDIFEGVFAEDVSSCDDVAAGWCY